jgi:hypothetical protein
LTGKLLGLQTAPVRKTDNEETKFGDYETFARFPVFSNFTVYIVFTVDIRKSYEARYTGSLDHADTEALTAYGAKHARMFFKVGDACTGTIAHESVHAIQHLLEDFADVRKIDYEVLAYHVGYLVQSVADFRNKLIDAGIGVDK